LIWTENFQRFVNHMGGQKIVPWLLLNHEGLDVLIHPLTESSYDDHSKNALRIGTPVPMRLDLLPPCRPNSAA
jgi:aromatic ring-cleaving dioxygenase